MAEPTQRFRITADPPVRALGAGSVLTLVGAGLLVLGAGTDRTAWSVLGSIGLGLGLILALLGGLFWARLRSAVVVDAASITVRRGRRARTLRWAEVQEVTATPIRLTLVPKSGRPLAIVNPQPGSAQEFDALAAAIRARLDADRGYRSLS